MGRKAKYTSEEERRAALREYQRAWREKNKDRARQREAEWRAKNRDKIREGFKAWWKTNGHRCKEKNKQYMQERLSTEEGRAEWNRYCRERESVPGIRIKRLASAAICRAKKNGLEFDSDLGEHLGTEPATHCVCCKYALDYSTGKGFNNKVPSLDRFDNNKGYTKDNVVVICYRCNSVKKDATVQELLTVVKYMSGEQCTSNI